MSKINKPSVILFLASAFLALTAGVAQAAPSSSFDSGTDGWKIADFVSETADFSTPNILDADFQSAGGSLGGYISKLDFGDGSFFFQGNSNFTGNLSAYYGGVLNYSVKDTFPNGFAQWRGDPDVVLVSGTQSIVFQHADNPGSDWTPYSTVLSETGWRSGNLAGGAVSKEQFQSFLSNVTAFYIRGEYIAGSVENVGLDSVSITPVPEPSQGAMLLGGLALCAWIARKKTSMVG